MIPRGSGPSFWLNLDWIEYTSLHTFEGHFKLGSVFRESVCI